MILIFDNGLTWYQYLSLTNKIIGAQSNEVKHWNTNWKEINEIMMNKYNQNERRLEVKNTKKITY